MQQNKGWLRTMAYYDDQSTPKKRAGWLSRILTRCIRSGKVVNSYVGNPIRKTSREAAWYRRKKYGRLSHPLCGKDCDACRVWEQDGEG